MIRTGLLLAAGASRRFGPSDKLLAMLHGSPLVSYAAMAMRSADLDERIAVIANPELASFLEGFRIVCVEPGEQSGSLRAGLQAASSPDLVLIALADMPLVTAAHLNRVLEGTRDDRPATSQDKGLPMVPACFPKSWLPRLAALDGDRGASSLIRDLPTDAIVAAPDLLADIDTLEDLAAMQKTGR